MREVDYLLDYYPFDDEILDAAEKASRRQSDVTWPEYVSRFNIPRTKVFEPKDGKPIEVLDLIPHDYDQTLVYHQPMACILDSNRQIHVATLQAILPNKRIIGVGNPGQPGHGYGKVSMMDALKVARGNLRPVVAGTLEYLHSQGIESAIHAGESYGADKAAASAENSTSYSQEATSIISVEPVSVAKKGLLRMGWAFMSTGKHAEKYLKPVRSVSHTFKSAEELRESPKTYALGLARLSNIAIGAALGKPGFQGRVERAMVINPSLKTGIAWGTSSEFDENNERESLVRTLKGQFGAKRIADMPVEGQTHAMNLDPFMNSAIIS